MTEVTAGPEKKDNPDSAYSGGKRFRGEVSTNAKGLRDHPPMTPKLRPKR